MDQKIDYVLRAQMTEVSDRARRMETKMTAFLEWFGQDTRSEKPEFSLVRGRAVVTIPTPNVSLFDLIRCVPKDYESDEPISVYHRGDVIMQFFVGEE